MKLFHATLIFIMLNSCVESEGIQKLNKNSLNQQTIVGIQPYGDVHKGIIDSIASEIRQQYGFEVKILNPKSAPKNAFVNIKSPRYRADSIIRQLKRNKPDNLNYIIGITNFDISTTKKDKVGNVRKPERKYQDWGVFGLGYRPGPTCVVSLFRLGGDARLRLQRVKKVSLHELGHNLGLKHCVDKACLMTDAVESIKTVDSAKANLCEKCMGILGMAK